MREHNETGAKSLSSCCVKVLELQDKLRCLDRSRRDSCFEKRSTRLHLFHEQQASRMRVIEEGVRDGSAGAARGAAGREGGAALGEVAAARAAGAPLSIPALLPPPAAHRPHPLHTLVEKREDRAAATGAAGAVGVVRALAALRLLGEGGASPSQVTGAKSARMTCSTPIDDSAA